MIDTSRQVVLRRANPSDAAVLARILRAALASFEWMPVLHTPDEDFAFIAAQVLPNQAVTVAEAGEGVIGFIAIKGEWIDLLYLDPAFTGGGIGARLLMHATETMPAVKLRCFQANSGARRFYGRHGFKAEAFGDGGENEEGLPDILYVRRR